MRAGDQNLLKQSDFFLALRSSFLDGLQQAQSKTRHFLSERGERVFLYHFTHHLSDAAPKKGKKKKKSLSFRFVSFQNEGDKWTDLCACDQPFCNTFAFLRSHTRRTPSSSSTSSASSSSSAFSSSSDGFAQPPSSSSHFDSSRQEDPADDSSNPHDAPLVFHRMDRPDDGSIPPAPPGLMEREGPNKTSLLTLLLVVVPLTVGAATVMVSRWILMRFLVAVD
uniref:Transmembrane protein n=1 Tax=Caenorhabditis japonica TaxID=281687 RepID=A0A8R1ESN2_CAEJA